MTDKELEEWEEEAKEADKSIRIIFTVVFVGIIILSILKYIISMDQVSENTMIGYIYHTAT